MITSLPSVFTFHLRSIDVIIQYVLPHSGAPANSVEILWGHHRFLNFYGQSGARLDFTHSVHGPKRKQSFLIRILSPLLFYTPDVYLHSLEELWVDDLVRQVSWNKFFGRLDSEWIGLTVHATILLTANVALLAIPSVDNAQTHTRSAAQLASYLSITSSLGSIILGLLNIHQNHSRSYDYAVSTCCCSYHYVCIINGHRLTFFPIWHILFMGWRYLLFYMLFHMLCSCGGELLHSSLWMFWVL